MSSESLLMVNSIIESSSIYGPGDRFVIWVQGCTLGCKGCWNTQMWEHGIGEAISVNDLVKRITSYPNNEGITILGGEPFEQVEAIRNLISIVKKAGFTVMLYTGYEKEEFTSEMKICYDLSDLVIAGRYRQDLRDVGLIWRGSTNQILESPTGFYDVSEFEEAQEVEVLVNHESGEITITGYPDMEMVRALQDITN